MKTIYYNSTQDSNAKSGYVKIPYDVTIELQMVTFL